MSDGWPKMKLSDAGVILLDCDHKTPEAVEVGRPYIGIPQMTSGRIDFSTARQISEDDFVTWNRKTKYQRNDVVLSRRTNPGVTAIDDTGTEFALGQNLVLLRANGKRVDPPFLRWLVRTPEWWEQIEKFMNVGAVFSSLRCRDVPSFELTIPPLPEQRAIAATLGALDDKIELNRKMNATLEAMARALFRDWFVDFGPTRAKVAGTVPYLSPDLWSLFPDSLDDEGKPKGWEMSTVKEIGDVICGKTPPTAQRDYYGGDIPFITIPDMHGTIFAIDTSKTLSLLGSESQKKKLLPTGTICVSCIATLGLVVITTEPSQTNQQINSIIPQDPDEMYYWYWALRLLSTEIISGGSGGSVLANLSTGRFSALSLLHASPRLRKEFSRCVAPLFERIKANQSETRTLAQTRDLLLPRLMSGELRVADLSELETA